MVEVWDQDFGAVAIFGFSLYFLHDFLGGWGCLCESMICHMGSCNHFVA